MHIHQATPETAGSAREVCACGMVRDLQRGQRTVLTVEETVWDENGVEIFRAVSE